MTRDYDIVTFDCYGTLIDWEAGIGDAFIRAAVAYGIRVDRAEVLRAHAEIEPVVQAESFRSYREVLRETARRMAARLGWKLDEAGAGFLPDSLPRWKIFDDTNPALERLTAAGYRLGILSNVDDDLLAGTLEQFRVGDFREATAHAALDQDMTYSANVVFIWTALFERSMWKYRQRAYRYVYLDAGHIAHSIALAAVALGKGSCQIAALFDDEVNSILEIDGEKESVLYMTVVGHPW